jgi:hypothetical protein
VKPPPDRPGVELLGPAPPPRPVYHVAVVGAADWADEDALARLVLALAARVRDTHRLGVLCAAHRSPDLTWAHHYGWSLTFVPAFGGRRAQNDSVAQFADALLVIGNSRPERDLVAAFEALGKPVRHYAKRPRIPRWSELVPAADGLAGQGAA